MSPDEAIATLRGYLPLIGYPQMVRADEAIRVLVDELARLRAAEALARDAIGAVEKAQAESTELRAARTT